MSQGQEIKSDEELLLSLQKGNQAGLDELFRRHYAALCLVAVRLTKDQADAEDIVQDFFLSIWKKRSVLPQIDNVGAYLRRSVRNRSLNFLRDQKRIPRGEDDELINLATSAESTSQALETEELQLKIDRAIEMLPERCRLIFVLSRLEDMPQKEIAEALGISRKTVENQMGRAYQFLKQYLSAFLLIGLLMSGSP
jgi:RNA polymerase sigma-70 factor (ECF subfamily)